MESILLKLSTEHFPLPHPLHSLVLDLYTPEKEVGAMLAMELTDILAYLKNIDRYELSPLQGILLQAEAIGDPTLPSSEQTAILEWLNTAYTYWEKHYLTEEPLASEFRKLLPLGAALAITDPNFLTPGGHSFHLLLDTMQASVIGWQSRLGRAGQSLERELVKTVAKARQWFELSSVELSIVYQDVVAATKKDRGRAQRMTLRTIETEQGRVKKELARIQCAQMINSLLEKYGAPHTIGEFLKGPWNDSGQLVLLKFGLESKQWASMLATTEVLLDSLQAGDGTLDKEGKPDGSRRQQVFEAITKLPRKLRRWLLSLAHDDLALNEAIAVIETAHMSVLRRQDINLQTIEPIALTNATTADGDRDALKSISQLKLGQWFLFSRGKLNPLRIQLVLKIEAGQQLLFTNHAGIKAIQQGYAEFSKALKEGVATPLCNDVSFSYSLAHAAKISSQSDLKSLSSTASPAVKQAQFQQEFEAVRATRQHKQSDQAPTTNKGFLSSPETEQTVSTRPVIKGRQNKLTMGAWLGFHDGDTPLLAKLAAHDRKEDKYIFVNRKGIKMRDLSKQELLSLINKGLVEILEARSNFKDEDTRARNKHKS